MPNNLTGAIDVTGTYFKTGINLFCLRSQIRLRRNELYLLELVRYIHLNPIRAGMVKDLKALNSYSRSGHALIIGRIKHNLTPSAVSKLVSSGRLETETREIAKELPAVK
jgi:hypothetical protein